MNEYQPISEASLPVASSTKDVGHLRAVATTGGSVLATPAQIREMVGIDYSSLEEQEVPGAKWRGQDGVELKKLYTRTIVIVTSSVVGESVALLGGISALFDVKVIFNTSVSYDDGHNLLNYYDFTVGSNGLLYFKINNSIRLNTTAVITFQYTK